MATAVDKTCFIISPIGGEGTDVRKLADDFLELLVEPALEKYRFNVIRGDRIANSSAITSDIVRLVQEADLCIIDITGNNPNVFYECGRRHETGRPFIQMIRRGDDKNMPFDVAGIRTLSYDVSSPRTVLESQRKLQEFIESLLSSGFEAGTSGESLSSIAQALERIERKVNAIISSPSTSSAQQEDSDDDTFDDNIRELAASPRSTFIKALKKGQIDRALSILPRLKKITDSKEYVAALALAVSIGSARAYEMMRAIYDDLLLDPSKEPEHDEMMMGAVQSFQSYFDNTGNIAEGLAVLEEACSRIIASDGFSKKTKGFIANKVGMLAWNGREYAKCIQYTKMAFDQYPEPAYAYNLALVYDQKDMKAELDRTLETLSKLPELDADHKRLLKQHGLSPKGAEAS